ncbi:MAG: DNA polymerase III subunit psi [Gammaproteobacteria bacterium]|nr:DNA polymerase III subunit psi [Gammaproteobacteria bacterium]
MDNSARHWYLQQMGIPVWVPKGSEPAASVVAPATEVPPQQEAAPVAQPVSPQSAQPQPSGLSPAQAIAEGLRAQQSVDASVSDQAVSLWLVMPNVAPDKRGEADALVDKVLAAVEVPVDRVLKLWAVPDALPPQHIKHLWCFGIQPPPGLTASSLLLPPVSEMLTNVDAKRQAWQQLKGAMPFV